MANLTSLIRLRKHNVDQKQKFLAGLYRRAEELEAQKSSLNEQVATERTLLEEQEMLEALAWFGSYAANVKIKIESIDREIFQMEKRIEIARADLRESFAEMKKIEITHNRRMEAEKKALSVKEDKELDEIGVERHRRKSDV